ALLQLDVAHVERREPRDHRGKNTGRRRELARNPAERLATRCPLSTPPPDLLLPSARRQHQAVPLDVVAELRIHVVLVVEGENVGPCLPGPALTGRDLRAQ